LLLLQERLANALASEVGVTNKQLSHLKKSEREHLLTALTAWQLPVQVIASWLGGVPVLRAVG
jgi:outer membrane biogenesis lipoprotein LolB